MYLPKTSVISLDSLRNLNNTNLTEDKDFVKKQGMNLWLQNLADYDPSLNPGFTESVREKDESVDVAGSFKYGLYGSKAAAWELVASLPGGVERLREWVAKISGKKAPTEDDLLDNVESYFRKKVKHNLKALSKYEDPEGFWNNFIAMAAASPLTLISYIPAVKAASTVTRGAKLFGLPQQVPAGIAATEFLREWDKGSAGDVLWAATKGYALGSAISFASQRQLLLRTGILATLGYAQESVHGASLDKRLAAAAVWGTFGLIPTAPRKPQQTRYGLEKGKELSEKELSERNIFMKQADEAIELKRTLRDVLNKHFEAKEVLDLVAKQRMNNKKVTVQKKKIERSQNRLLTDPRAAQLVSERIEVEAAKRMQEPIFARDLIEPENITVTRLQEIIKQLDVEIRARQEAAYDYDKVSIRQQGMDLRRPTEVKIAAVTDNLAPRYPDLKGNLKGKMSQWFAPGSFVSKFAAENPIVKWGTDRIRRSNIEATQKISQILYNLRYTKFKKDPNTGRFEGQKAGETESQFRLRAEVTGKFTPKLRILEAVPVKSYEGSAITKFEVYWKTDPNKGEKVSRAIIEADKFKHDQAKANNEPYNKRINNTDKFKYEVTDHELRTIWKLDPYEISIVRDVYGGIKESMLSYLKAVEETVGQKSAKTLSGRLNPNYFPHMWEGEFRIFASKRVPTKDGTGIKLQAIETRAANNRAHAERIEKELQSKYAAENEKIETKIVLPTEPLAASRFQSKDIASFYRELNRLDKNESLPQDFKTTLTKYFEIEQRPGIKKHFLKRGTAAGYMGTEKGNVGLANFQRAVETFVGGAIRASENLKAETDLHTLLHTPLPSRNSTKTNVILADPNLYPNTAQFLQRHFENAGGTVKENAWIKAANNAGAKWIGKSGLGSILGTLNKAALHWALLFFNPRFTIAQFIQPYHMLWPKLVDLKVGGLDKGNITVSYVRALRDMVFADKEAQSAQKYFYEHGLVESKFVTEAIEGRHHPAHILAPGYIKKHGFKRYSEAKKEMEADGEIKVINYAGKAETIVGQRMAARVEQFSRMQAGLIFYRFLRSAGHTPERAKNIANTLGDQYMVEYNYIERPGIYSEAGLGTIGRPAGLFKTFAHNYISQLWDYFKTGQRTGDYVPLAAFLTQMTMVGGLYGIFLSGSVDWIMDNVTNPLFKKLGKKERILNYSETVALSDQPEILKYGIPSSLLGMDLTTTLASPGLTPGDLASMPALEMFGLYPKSFKDGLLLSTMNLLPATIGDPMGNSGIRKDAWKRFWINISPNSMKGFVERYYAEKPLSDFEIGTSDGFGFMKGTSMDYLGLRTANPDEVDKLIVRDVKRGRKERGTIKRGSNDWVARFFSMRSLEEREALRFIYVTTQLNKNLKFDIDTIVTKAAYTIMNYKMIPPHLYDAAFRLGFSAERLEERVENRVELMNTTLLERTFKRTGAFKDNPSIAAIRDVIKDKYITAEGKITK